MRTLNFSVNEQTIKKEGDFSKIVKGSKGYLQCKFDFSNEWSSYQVAAVFEYKENVVLVPVVDSICSVPDSMTDGLYFCIKLLGVKAADQYFYTEKVLVEQED